MRKIISLHYTIYKCQTILYKIYYLKYNFNAKTITKNVFITNYNVF